MGFHNLVFADEFGPAAFITRARKEGIRDFGACMAPMTAFQILQGLETLPLRMQKHVANALEVAGYLEQHEMVASVSYPGLPSHPDYELAQRMLPKGCGAVFSFEIKGGRRRRALYRKPECFLSFGQRGGCQVLGDTPGKHDAPSG